MWVGGGGRGGGHGGGHGGGQGGGGAPPGLGRSQVQL
ncbi:PREDICTED: holotricin-3-like, partial [Chaetura pelagica]